MLITLGVKRIILVILRMIWRVLSLMHGPLIRHLLLRQSIYLLLLIGLTKLGLLRDWVGLMDRILCIRFQLSLLLFLFFQSFNVPLLNGLGFAFLFIIYFLGGILSMGWFFYVLWLVFIDLCILFLRLLVFRFNLILNFNMLLLFLMHV